MKTLRLSTLLFLLLSVGVKADEAKRFSLFFEYVFIEDVDRYVSTNYEEYWAGKPVSFFNENGDTIIMNGKTYYKLYGSTIYYGAPPFHECKRSPLDLVYRCGVRQDNGRILVNYDEYVALAGREETDLTPVGDPDYIPYEVTGDGEIVLYDFNMKVGDKFRSVEGREDIILLAKEMNVDGTGDEFNMLTYSNGAQVIEGVGCSNSPGMFLGWLNPKKQDDNMFSILTCGNIEEDGVSIASYGITLETATKRMMKSMFEGKTRWNYFTATLSSAGDITDKAEHTIFADGRVMAKNGKIYHSLFTDAGGQTLRLFGLRENNGRVYADRDEYMALAGERKTWPVVYSEYIPYGDDGDVELVVYDFNMKPGDRLRSVAGNADATVVSACDTVTPDYITRRMLTLSNGVIMIEGIGCIATQPTGAQQQEASGGDIQFTSFASFAKYNCMVYTKSDKDIISDVVSGIDSPESFGNARRNGKIYNINGQLLTKKPAHGIYIQDGKKRTVE